MWAQVGQVVAIPISWPTVNTSIVVDIVLLAVLSYMFETTNRILAHPIGGLGLCYTIVPSSLFYEFTPIGNDPVSLGI